MGSNFIGRKDERILLDEKEKDESDETVRWLSDDMRENQSEKRTNMENNKLIYIQRCENGKNRKNRIKLNLAFKFNSLLKNWEIQTCKDQNSKILFRVN